MPPFAQLKDHWVNQPSAVRGQDSYQVYVRHKNDKYLRTWGTDTTTFNSCCCRACGSAAGRGTARTMHHWLDPAWPPALPPQLFPSLPAYERQTYCPCHLLLCRAPQRGAGPAPQRGQVAMAPLTSPSESYWPDLLSHAGWTEEPSHRCS